uniref:Uncharacterized protein n=1 Tax=Solanum lycopersicum TaxID=4081 RepID=A0A3Q7IZC4_SOLLC
MGHHQTRNQRGENSLSKDDREILLAELFNVLREKIGANNLNSLVEEKVFPIAGDISIEDFGIENSEIKYEMLKEIDN